MTNSEFEQIYFPKYESVIKAIARKIAHRNDALMDDLISEGMIALWKTDPKKAKDNPDAYIRQAIKFRMIDWMRKEKPAMYESLDQGFERGDQLVQDPDTNEITLVHGRELSKKVTGDEDTIERHMSVNERVRDRLEETREEE